MLSGTGELTLQLADAIKVEGAQSALVHGIDASADMIEKASAVLHEGGAGLSARFEVTDGHDLAEKLSAEQRGSFDKVFR